MGTAYWVAAFLILAGIGVYTLMVGRSPSIWRIALLPLGGAALVFAGLLNRLGPQGAQYGVVLTLALISLWSALRVVTHQKSVYSALYFVLVIIATSGMLLVMNAEFLAMATVIIYAGAILVTYIFVIMLAQKPGVANVDSQSREPFFGIASGFVVLAIILVRLFTNPPQASVLSTGSVPAVGSTLDLGKTLMTDYIMALQIAGVLLTAAMVGAIAVAHRKAVDGAAQLDDDE